MESGKKGKIRIWKRMTQDANEYPIDEAIFNGRIFSISLGRKNVLVDFIIYNTIRCSFRPQYDTQTSWIQ